MAETAAHLVDHVFPIVPVRQWVLSIPFALRYRLAYDSGLLSDVLNVFIRVVFVELRRRARELLGLKLSQCGAVTFVQRCGDALNLAPHFHSLVIQGVYAADENGQPEFHELPPPEDADVVRVAALVAQRVESLLKRRGLGPDGDSDTAEALSRDEPGLVAIYSASIRGRIASGPHAGNRVLTLGDQVDGDSLDSLQSPRCATVSGFSVHANVSIDARDRLRLTISSLRFAACRLDRTFVGTAGRPASVSFEAQVAQRDHRGRLSEKRLYCQTRRAGTRSAHSPSDVPRNSRSRRQMASSDRSHTGRAIRRMRPRSRPARIQPTPGKRTGRDGVRASAAKKKLFMVRASETGVRN